MWWRKLIASEWLVDEEEEVAETKENINEVRGAIPNPPVSTLPPVQLGFGGCGGMYSYFLGVAAVIQKNFKLDNVIFSGSSAGCFPAMFLALDLDIEKEFKTFHAEILNEARDHPLRALGRWIPIVRKHTMKKLQASGDDAYKAALGRLFCSMTSFPAFKNHLVGDFESNADLVDSVLASASVAFYADSLTQNFRGSSYIDGSLTNNSPVPHGSEYPSKVLQVWHWRWMSPTWALISTCSDWTQQLFDWGKEDALQNLDDLATILTYKS